MKPLHSSCVLNRGLLELRVYIQVGFSILCHLVIDKVSSPRPLEDILIIALTIKTFCEIEIKLNPERRSKLGFIKGAFKRPL